MSQSSVDGSVTGWIRGLKEGDHASLEKLIERYFSNLARVAKKEFGRSPRIATDEEDIALDVFHTLARNAASGKYPSLLRRDDLWTYLLDNTRIKVFLHKRTDSQERRGAGKLITMTDLVGEQILGFDESAKGDVSPETFVIIADQCAYLFGLLDDELQRKVAIRKLEGMNGREIAKQLRITTNAVYRKVKIIQQKWSRDLGVPFDATVESGKKEPLLEEESNQVLDDVNNLALPNTATELQ